MFTATQIVVLKPIKGCLFPRPSKATLSPFLFIKLTISKILLT